VQNTVSTLGTATLIGSGEMAPSMARIHRELMARIAGPVRGVFLDTPAGFQLNADELSARAVEYFRERFDRDLYVASFKAAAEAQEAEMAEAVRKLRWANYIFAGPGSPTYAVRNWQNTPVYDAMAGKLATGAHLVFASAAAIAMSRYALPVYEIYKVGTEPHWVEGLDLLGPYGADLAIVPHWNNTEGGTHDTRYAFIGEPRFRVLEEHLPDSTIVLGIDEYTACTVDLEHKRCLVQGAGQITLRHKGHEIHYPAGSSFELDRLRIPSQGRQEIAPVSAVAATGTEPDVAPRQPFPEWNEQPCTDEEELALIGPYVDLLIWVRTQLRDARQWKLADRIRDRLGDLGILLEDGPDGTTWRRA
jgi:hypothetical protein